MKFPPFIWIVVFMLYRISMVSAQTTSVYYDERDGQTYRTITVGLYEWMAQNLNFETDSGSWCYDESNLHCMHFGRFYNYETAQQACMPGWKLPEREDWDTLFSTLSLRDQLYLTLLKDGANDLKILLAGWHGEYGGSYLMGEQARFWTSTSKTQLNAWYIGIFKSTQSVRIDYDSKGLGLSVRCTRKRQE